jgi:hypothetical protein
MLRPVKSRAAFPPKLRTSCNPAPGKGVGAFPSCKQDSMKVSQPRYSNYLCTYDLYGPVRNVFDAGSIHYDLQGQVGGGWALEIESFLYPVK